MQAFRTMFKVEIVECLEKELFLHKCEEIVNKYKSENVLMVNSGISVDRTSKLYWAIFEISSWSTGEQQVQYHVTT